jgi:hypothetical protein
MLAIGNEELGESIAEGELVKCPHCKGFHKAIYGTDRKTGEPSNMIIAVKCKRDLYLVGVAGKSIGGKDE